MIVTSTIRSFPATPLQTQLVILVLAFSTFAGGLDPTFGTGGTLTLNPSGAGLNSYGTKIYVQPGGRILAAAAVTCVGGPPGIWNGPAMIGLTATGALDTTFGSGGVVRNCSLGDSISAEDTQMLPDGRYLVGGFRATIFNTFFSFLDRYTANGQLDPTFSASLPSSGGEWPRRFALQSDGKIMTVLSNGKLMRLNPNGSRDQTFGTDGIKPRLERMPNQAVAGLHSLPNGKVYLAFENGTALKLDSDGNLDRSFGLQGVTNLIYDGGAVQIFKTIVQPDEKLLLIGMVSNPDRDVFIARFTRRGKLDAGFNGGVIVTDFSPADEDFATDGVVLENGKIVIAGQAIFPVTPKKHFLMAKYSNDGILEEIFNSKLFLQPDSVGRGLAVQPDQKILVNGWAGTSPFTNFLPTVVGIARFTDIKNSGSTIRRLYDFDGDGATDFSLFRPPAGAEPQAFWDVITFRNHTRNKFFGIDGDIPAPADFDNDGRTDVAVFRPSTGTWYYTTDINAAGFQSVSFGQKGDSPIANDFTGDSRADIAFFRASTGTWQIKNLVDGSVQTVQFGAAGDTPVTGDFDGDNRADVAVWRSSDATFRMLRSSDNAVIVRQLGASGNIPVPADYDGDRNTDFAIFDQTAANWLIILSASDQTLPRQWGSPNDIPVPGDYDIDGNVDLAVFRPSDASWRVSKSSDSASFTRVFGQPTDIPLPGK